FAEHAGNDLGLTIIKKIAEAIIEAGLLDVKANRAERGLLRLEHGAGEIDQPIGYFQRGLMAGQLIVIGLAAAFYRMGEHDEAGLPDILGQRLFGQGPADAAIAILEGVDALEIEMPDARPGERRK